MGFSDADSLVYCVFLFDWSQFALRHPRKPLVYAPFHVSEELVKGKGNSTKEVLKRIDYGGSFTLFGSVSLSVRYRSVPLTLRTRWVVCSSSSAISTTMSCLGIHLR